MKAPNPPRPKPCQDDGGPAFPTAKGEVADEAGGMSLRDACAIAALQGLCANSTNSEVRGLGHFPSFAAAWAYRMADAMLDERAKGRQA